MKKAIPILLLSLFFLSCEKEDDDLTLEESKTATITLSPNETKWFLREPSDSIRVLLNGGVAPYVIKDRPGFSSKAIIRGNELHVFPNHFTGGDPFNLSGYDFINIEDNLGNSNTFNIYVEYQKYWYTDSLLSISSQGDTAIKVSSFELELAEYDGFFDNLALYFKSTEINLNNRLEINIEDIDTVGVYRPQYFGLVYYHFGTRHYYKIDSNQVINVTKFNLKEIEGNYTILVKTLYDHEVTLSGYFYLNRE